MKRAANENRSLARLTANRDGVILKLCNGLAEVIVTLAEWRELRESADKAIAEARGREVALS